MDSFRISLRPKHPGVQPQLHHLPCSIDHHGSANVNIFFCPELKSTTETDEWQASLRGRALVGRTISVPTGYEGLILEECHTASTTRPATDAFMDNESSELGSLEEQLQSATLRYQTQSTFEQWTRWRHDYAPETTSGPWMQALEWAKLSELIHMDTPQEDSTNNEEIHKRKRDDSLMVDTPSISRVRIE